MLGPDQTQHGALRALAAVTEGKVLISASNVKGGIAAFDRALAYYRVTKDVPERDVARLLNNRGLLLSDDGQFEAAEKSLTESLARYQHSVGETHLLSGQTWFALAQNAFNSGNLPLAERRIANALQIERKVLDADNPIIADTLSMQGQILHGAGKLPQAERALREAVVIYRNGFKGPHYLIGIAEVYLALIESDRGRHDEALATLADAKANYDAGYGKTHPNHGDLQVNRAKILAKAGRLGEARQECASGIGILNETLGADASFTKMLAADCARLGAVKPPKLTVTGG
jgi:tetratricopeptide (TPR) repeat protein